MNVGTLVLRAAAPRLGAMELDCLADRWGYRRRTVRSRLGIEDLGVSPTGGKAPPYSEKSSYDRRFGR